MAPPERSGGADAAPPEGIRLQKLMAAAGVASRRVSENLIAAGRVEVNGEVVTELGRRVSDTDLVSVDVTCVEMMPARDPLRSLVYHAADRAVRDVYVDGRQVVAAGKVLTMDQEDAALRLAEGQARMIAAVRQRDYKGRSAEEISPLSLPMA